MELTTSQVLNKAADLIEERGWAKGALAWGTGSPESPLCLEGGILAALGRTEWPSTFPEQHAFWTCPAYLAVASYLDLDATLVNGMPTEDVYSFNDAQGRTATEVIEVLRATALIEAAREEQDAAWETYVELVTA